MKNHYLKFDGMSYRDIRWRLHGQGLPDDLIEKTIATIQADRQERGDVQRRKKVHGKAWQELIAGLQHERRIVRSMVRYKTLTPAPERDEFVNAYYAALNKLHEKLTLLRRRGGMPEYGHWTDYVPQRIKDALTQAAAAIPPRHKAKFKDPFQRTSPIDLRNLRHGRLLRRTLKEREAVLLRLETNPEDAQAKRKVEILDTALKRIRALADNAYVPDHWRDMVPDMFDTPDALTDEPKPPRKPRKVMGGIRPTIVLYAGKPTIVNEYY